MENVRLILGLVASIETWGCVTTILDGVLRKSQPLLQATLRAAGRFGTFLIFPLAKTIILMPVHLIKLLTKMVLTIFQIPIDIVWSLVPGLSKIPTPNIASVIKDNADANKR